MTNAEAVEILKHLRDDLHLQSKEYIDCFDTAISALEKQEQKKPLTNDVTPIKCTGLKCPMQAGKVDPATCKAADACKWATKPMTNADRIRAMTDEDEMARYFLRLYKEACGWTNTRLALVMLLKQEVKE